MSFLFENEIKALIDQLMEEKLNNKSIEELRELIGLDKIELNKRLDEMLDDLSHVISLKEKKEKLIATNKSIAKENFAKQPKFNEIRTALTLVHQKTLDAQKQLMDKQQKVKNIQPKHTLVNLKGLLQTAAQQSEEQSERIADEFVNGQLSYEEFLEQFLKERKLSHTRRIKYEKLVDSLQNVSIKPTTSSSIAPVPLSGPFVPLSLPLMPMSAPFTYPQVLPVRSAPLPSYMDNVLPPYPVDYSPVNNPPSYPHSINFGPK